MRTPEGDRIFAILAQHVGPANAIHAEEIAKQLGWSRGSERMVRDIIATDSPSWPGVLLCSTAGPAGGFYLAADYDEIASNDLRLQSAAINALAKLKAARVKAAECGIALPPVNLPSHIADYLKLITVKEAA